MNQKKPKPEARCRECRELIEYHRGRPPVWCDEHHPSMKNFEPREMAWPIVGSTRWDHVEVIDRADSHSEAERLVTEYSLAFGPSWRVSTFQKPKPIDWEPSKTT